VIDLYRLCRAVHLDCERIADHRYRVSGAGHSYEVNLEADRECPCPDAVRPCKHVLRAMMAEGDRDTVQSLRAVVPLPGARRLIRAA
jgi:hypothetical protein